MYIELTSGKKEASCIIFTAIVLILLVNALYDYTLVEFFIAIAIGFMILMAGFAIAILVGKGFDEPGFVMSGSVTMEEDEIISVINHHLMKTNGLKLTNHVLRKRSDNEKIQFYGSITSRKKPEADE